MEQSLNLLDEAIGDDLAASNGVAIVIEDCVETTDAFILHHLIKCPLSPHSSALLIYVTFAQPFLSLTMIAYSKKCMHIPDRLRVLYSLMEVAANGSSNDVLDFLHYCHTLTTQFGCSFILLTHEDIYSATGRATLILQMECLADVLVKAEPLATGSANDVHGQLTVLNKGICDGLGISRNKMRNFNFRLKESCAEYFIQGVKLEETSCSRLLLGPM